MSSTETEKYTLRELVRNNCVCCAENKACDICKIDKQVALAVKEWLEQKLGDFKFNEYDTPLTDNLQGAKEQLQELIGELTV